MKLKALKAAFPYTIPIFASFWFLGLSLGIYARTAGFPIIMPIMMAIIIFGGSLEFVTVAMLLQPFAPVTTFVMAVLIQARHLFYGIAMLEKYKGLGWKKIYLIYALCDESFSINYSVDVPEGIDRGWFYFFVTFLDQMYWVTGVAIGAIVGSLLKFNTEGLSFVMTAMFAVIFYDQLKKEKQPYTGIIGLFASILCLLLFGADSFMIPTMILIIVLLAVFKKPILKAGEET